MDVKAGKVIRKDDHGFEVFDDYWTESGRITLRFTTTDTQGAVTPTLSNVCILLPHIISGLA